MIRPARKQGRTAGTQVLLPGLADLGFSHGWLPELALDNGSKVTILRPFLGGVALPAQTATGQSIPAASANLGGRKTISCDGIAGSGGYELAGFFGSAPIGLSVVQALYLGAPAVSAIWGTTVGGVVNTGRSLVRNTTLRTSEQNTYEALSVVSAPLAVVVGSIFTGRSVIQMCNTTAAVTTNGVIAPAGTTLHVMCRAAQASIPQVMTGEWGPMLLTPRILGLNQMALAVRTLGALCNVPIADK